MTRGDEAFVSQHIGDLDNAPTCRALDAAVAHLTAILGVRPEIVAHDLHPDFYSTRFAVRLGAQWGVPTQAVPHHQAHIAAVVAEHRWQGTALGLALDGVGLGPDGSAGRRVAIRRRRTLPASRAVAPAAFARRGSRRARTVAHGCAQFALAGRGDEIGARYADEAAAATVADMLARGINAPQTSSMGRWFDAAAGLLDVKRRMAFEGQAAMLLEGIAERHGAVPADPSLYAIGP